ncbi:MAG: ABC transporter substrate-binding protein [Eubacteriales bacterium]|nr:ABC transporter substrate-binding protein [Eubacteriales bacterium]
MKRRFLALVLGAAMTASLIAGCGKSSGTSGGGNDHAQNNEIVIGIPQDLDQSLDPHYTVAAGTKEVMFNVFEGLVKYDSTGNTVPAVASDVAVSDDGLTYTFTLREGIKFHNGEAVDLDDVIYSITRCKEDEQVNAQTRTGLACIDKLEKDGDSKLVMTLTEPNTELMSLLTLAIIPEGYDAQDTAPVGTGPYRFVSRTALESVVLEKFADYWGTPAGLDKVTYKINEKADALINGLNSGAYDLVSHLTTVQTAELNDADFNIEAGPMNLVQALYLNNAKAPFDDVRVRQALCYAVDRQGVLDMAFDGKGFLIGSNVFPSFTKYFDESLVNYYTKDTQKAKELLAEAGYPDGFSMTITVPANYQPHVDTAEVMAEQLKEIGIEATLKPVEWQTWLDETYTGRDFEATVIGLTADPLTARSLLERFTSDAGNNFINYNNAEYDELFAKAVACYDDAEQVKIYKEMEKNLTENAASVYVQDMADLVAVRKGLTGLTFYPLYVLDVSTLKWE